MTVIRNSSVLLLMLSASHAIAQAPTSPLLARASQVVEKAPTLERRIGLAELQRAHGNKQAGLDELEKAAKSLAADDARAIEVQELLCWRMLPVATVQRAIFKERVARLKTLDSKNTWVPVFEVYLLAGEPNRPAFRAAIMAASAQTPAHFPTAFAEKAHLELLKELGHGRVQAGVEVIAARTYEPLHALRDLDRSLTREAGFLRSSEGVEAEARVVAVRDRYRLAYQKASRHLVERLFALHLAEQAKERDELLDRAKALPYLHDPKHLAGLLQRLEVDQAWQLLIEPLLNSELAVITNPPDLTKIEGRSVAELQIKARKKTVQEKSVRYEGDVRVRLHALEVACEQMTVLSGDDPAAVVLTGERKARLHGITDYPAGVSADRFVYHAATGAFTLGGDIRLKSHDKTLKLRACTITQNGALRDRRSWIDDFKNALSLATKLELLPTITKVYDDAELAGEVRYLLALQTLRPHLTWHAPYLPLYPERRELRELIRQVARHWRDSGAAWQEALVGEEWMHGDVKPANEAVYGARLQVWQDQREAARREGRHVPPEMAIAGKETYFWRIRDPQHPDVVRALRLLDGVYGTDFGGRAQRWASEIRRNNTVLTFDIAGAAPLGKAHSLLMDARNADSVSFKLYRVERPEELAYGAKNIGTDFLYRDHRLDEEFRNKILDVWKHGAYDRKSKMERKRKDAPAAPDWKSRQPVHQWTARVAELKHHSRYTERRSSRRWRDDDDWHNESDARYFDDECSEHQERIDKSYRPDDADLSLSSWQCDRVVTIPAKALSDAGAYVLIAEANGQTAHVPIVVEPLSLTLRRCRDGVFALVADAEGKRPLDGATVVAAPSRRWAEGEGESALTDKEGVAFARFLAFGDRPVIAHHQGRYAIGGFGQVFEGIYESFDRDEPGWALERQRDSISRLERAARSASVYADRHVVLAYTDRPTYRPGQAVQFKLIVRKLLADPPPANAARLTLTFRGEEFDARTRMVLPDLDQDVVYAVLDPKGREVSHGSLKLSKFGTAAGSVALNDESVVGSYALRVRLAGTPRIVPDVFVVKHYRRPNFEVELKGVPATLTKPDKLTLLVSGKYYFGPPLTAGAVELRVVRKNLGTAIVEADGRLDAAGHAKIEVRLPRSLDAGKYHVVCSVTDDSGRTVTTTAPLTLESPDGPRGIGGLTAMPRFHALEQELKFPTTAREIRVQQDLTDLRVPVKNSSAVLKFAQPGWYRVTAGDDEARLFVYGGSEHPLSFGSKDKDRDDRAMRVREPKWVNLSDFAFEENQRLSRWEKPSQHLFALFDQQSAKPGEKLRLLVYVPHKSARLLFTLEGYTVLDYAVVRAKASAGAYQVVEIPIKERYYPNVYLQGRLLLSESEGLEQVRNQKKAEEQAKRGLAKLVEEDYEELDPRWCRIDVVKPAGNRVGELNVQIETDQATYRPGDSVRATVKVTDRNGKPQSAELSFAAVDESVYTFGEDNLDGLAGFFHTPHETRRFQPKAWRTSVGSRWSRQVVDAKQANVIHDLAKMADAMKAQTDSIQKMESARVGMNQHFTLAPLPRLGGEMPAGQIPLAKLREHFHETAAWLPQLYTDETGTARASFTLPDSLTRYRLTSVALTKSTEVGIGRARITAGLPLAVQVFVPRFGVEKDRMLAVALVHNHTKDERECQLDWRIEGATVDGPSPVPQDWKLVLDKGAAIGAGRVKVPANGSAKLGVWLKLEQVGTARIVFRATSGKESDAEVRVIPVQPIGKAAEINVNEELAAVIVKKPATKEIVGKFHREGRVQLPAGFLASELHISLAASDLAQSLDGLDYLVDYPHGCIEQTMSRFLPVVMIQHATQNSPIRLRPDIAKKLPDILEKGLTRVYGYQHADGSWGWFEKDSKNLPMSIYVVYGLARCQASGTKVDADVLKRGCGYLQQELITNRHEADLVARAWHALALAGHANVRDLEKLAREETKQVGYDRPLVWCHLALACRAAGLNEAGERLWAKVHRNLRSSWWGHDTESFALILKTQLAFGAPYNECRTMASRLLGKRTGTRWNHTRDTSWAIEALSSMLGYAHDKAGVRKLEVTLADKTILEVKDAADLKKLLHQVHLSAGQLPASESLEIRMKADSDEPIHVSVRAVGVQRQDEIKESGKRVKMQRFLETLDGEPLKESLKIGQVVRVRLRLHLERREDYLLIEERRATLCEFADDAISGTSARNAVHQEFRDDRLCVFFTSLSEGTHEIVYYLRAETPGRCSVLPGCAYPMYDEKARGETASNKVEVK